MMDHTPIGHLRAFALKSIAAERYPDDHHVFKVFECEVCADAFFRITVEYHTGATEGDFKGVIWGRCVACGHRQKVFSFTGDHRSFLREERPVCECGSDRFIAGECERIEGEQGLAGFFDEGVVVGECCHCGRDRVFAYTD
jgi:Zn ribbon nucleic-acid-binding protein